MNWNDDTNLLSRDDDEDFLYGGSTATATLPQPQPQQPLTKVEENSMSRRLFGDLRCPADVPPKLQMEMPFRKSDPLPSPRRRVHGILALQYRTLEKQSNGVVAHLEAEAELDALPTGEKKAGSPMEEDKRPEADGAEGEEEGESDEDEEDEQGGDMDEDSDEVRLLLSFLLFVSLTGDIRTLKSFLSRKLARWTSGARLWFLTG